MSFKDTNVLVCGARNYLDGHTLYTIVIPKPTMDDNRIVLTQDMMSKKNTKYIIKWNFVLGEDITVPKNCLIEFDGGSISNDNGENFSLTGQDTYLLFDLPLEEVLTVPLLGTFIYGVEKDKLDNTDGMAKIYLKRDKSLVEQIDVHHGGKPNTIYVIRYDFTLEDDVTLPENCILEFDGGSIGGAYTLTGDNSILKGCKNCIALNVSLAGTWVDTPVESNWFSIVGDCILNDDLTYASGTDNYQGFVNLFKFRNITINNGTYYVLYPAAIEVLSGTVVNGNNATIKAVYVTHQEFIKIVAGENIVIRNLVLIGAKLDKSDVGEWAAGIVIYEGKNISLTNIVSRLFRGDGFTIGNYPDHPEARPEHVIMENCCSLNNHRQGLSITSGNNIVIRNCTFAYTSGTAPQAGIDLETNSSDDILENVEIVECNLLYNTGSGIDILGKEDSDGHSNIRNIIIRGCKFESGRLRVFICESLNISNNYIHKDGIHFQACEVQQNIQVCNNIFDGLDYETKESYTQPAIFLINDPELEKNNIEIRNNIIKYFNSYGIHVTNGKCVNLKLEDNIIDHVLHNIMVWAVSNVLYNNNRITNFNKDYNGNDYDSFAWKYHKGDDPTTRIDLDTGLEGQNLDGEIPVGTMKFANGAPKWYNGTEWVDATGTPV